MTFLFDCMASVIQVAIGISLWFFCITVVLTIATKIRNLIFWVMERRWRNDQTGR
jgi:hypothetical protein